MCVRYHISVIKPVAGMSIPTERHTTENSRLHRIWHLCQMRQKKKKNLIDALTEMYLFICNVSHIIFYYYYLLVEKLHHESLKKFL